jgi:hypothetical protein
LRPYRREGQSSVDKNFHYPKILEIHPRAVIEASPLRDHSKEVLLSAVKNDELQSKDQSLSIIMLVLS